MKRIVVGLRPHARNEPIIRWIERYAPEMGPHVVIVHVVPQATLWIVSSVQANSTEYVHTLHKRFESTVVSRLRRQGISCEVRIERGDPVSRLIAVAHRLDAELIVVGSSEHNTLHDTILGNAVRKLEHLTDIPVLVVPTGVHSAHV